ncbi:HAD-IIA family hydrolase [Actinotignum timonense]|uniref:HAD-IIA family hydrolase n=1 Tax=Actinomycetaceae TaxID=2049 RepID=UPI00237EAB85|nr:MULTISPECIES: HAD-IIA family hydrolase [Actinotignum]MDE1654397.1 HAD-IIA family hydrolase [Actinotignum schaalii]MDK6907317.1 HAD-IIA family hydrolase [Actinotignum timonense]
MVSLISHFDGAIFDLDGVVYLGTDPAPHAADAYGRAIAAGMRPLFLTNNASRTQEEVAAHLATVGISAPASTVLTSAMASTQLAVSQVPAGAKALVIGGNGLHRAVSETSLVPVSSADDNPDVVIMGFYPTIDWAALSEVALAIRRGALFVATNLDATLPMERGFMVGCGSLVAAVVNATGVQPLSAGKPDPAIFAIGMDMLGASHPLAIGDRLNTDIRGARAAGIASLHVLTGVSSARDIMLAAQEERPDYLGDDLRVLNEDYPEIHREGERWVAGTSWAQVEEGHDGAAARLVTSDGCGPHLGLDTYRAAVHAIWEARDRGLKANVTLEEIIVERR